MIEGEVEVLENRRDGGDRAKRCGHLIVQGRPCDRAYISPFDEARRPFFAYDGEGFGTGAEINGTLVSAFTKRQLEERELS
jgi:hypothetical protein